MQLRQQVEDLRLHRHVQRRRGFIQQQHLWLEDQRPGDRHALALTSGELVRKAIAKGTVQPDSIQQAVHPAVPVADAVNMQRLLENIADGMTRMQ